MNPETGRSICLVFTATSERDDAVTALILTQLAAGQRCVYVGIGEADQELNSRLCQLHRSGDSSENSALVVMRTAEFFGDSSHDLAGFRDSVFRHATSALDKGFGGLFLAVDMGWLSSEKLTPGEIRAILSLDDERVTSLCVYDRNREPAAVLRIALESHPFILVDSKIVQNPYGLRVNENEPAREEKVRANWMETSIRTIIEMQDTIGDSIRRTHMSGNVPDDSVAEQEIEYVADALVSVDHDGNIVELNSIAQVKLGQSRDDLIGQNIWELFPEAIGSHTFQQIKHVAREQTVRQFETHSTVMNRWIEVTLVPNGEQIWISIRDISTRKQIEETLNARVRQQAAVAVLGQQALGATDLRAFMDNLVQTVQQTLEVDYVKVLELQPDKSTFRLVSGVGWKDGLVGSALVDAGLKSQAGYTLAAGGPVIVEDMRHETRFDGTPVLLDHEVTSGISVLISGDGGPFGVLGAHTIRRTKFTQDDVNFVQSVANILAAAIDHERAEEVQRHYAAIVSSSDDAIVGETLDGIITGWNAAAQRMFGYTADEVVGQPVTVLYPVELHHEASELLSDIRRGKRVEQHESVRRTKDGRLIDVSISLSPIRDRNGGIIGASKTARDISERKLSDLERLAERSPIATGTGGRADGYMGLGPRVRSRDLVGEHGAHSRSRSWHVSRNVRSLPQHSAPG